MIKICMKGINLKEQNHVQFNGNPLYKIIKINKDNNKKTKNK